MHDIYVKGGSIRLNNYNAPSGWAGGVVVNCTYTNASINDVTVQGVNFPDGSLPSPAPIGSQGQAPVEFINGVSACTNLRALDNSIGLMTVPGGGTNVHAILVRAPHGSVSLKGNDLSEWPSLSAAIYQSGGPTIWDAGNVVAPAPTTPPTPALGFLGITGNDCLQGNSYGAFGPTTGACEVTGAVLAYQRAGGAIASPAHCVIDTVSGTSGATSTRVTFKGASQFKTTAYTLLIQDVSTFGSPIVPTSRMTSSFSFPSLSSHSYSFIACGV
jgi:hypothetical protein